MCIRDRRRVRETNWRTTSLVQEAPHRFTELCSRLRSPTFRMANRRSTDQMDMIEPPDFKVVFVGAVNVGKSSLVVRFVKNEFSEILAPTTGAAFSRATVDLPEQGPIKLQLWDTAGQEKYRALVRIYYRGSAGAIVTFDQSDKGSFEYARSWVVNLRQEDPTMVIVLAANKSDLGDPRAFMKEVRQYCKQEDLLVFETSAKTGDGVQELFCEVASQVAKRYNRTLREESQGSSTAPSRDSVFGRDLQPPPPTNSTLPKSNGGCNC
eukprot:TRINITY_DN3534_c0_g1_i2.p1 TRINITY_DN3534_c0_g1~~TRINITY_DN3534_c0_g1_i2.p1  ORF type:complete len:266 (+),score=38.39 TRINITY_DN3534_c0_g1_i2:167-964(+)